VCEDVQGGGARVDLRAGPGVEEVGEEILASEKGRGSEQRQGHIREEV